MKILIATGIYPPEIGGPAEYAKNLRETWALQGHEVEVKIFGKFKRFPWGIRHVIFFFYILPSVSRSNCVFTLDAFSAGVVTVASKLFFKKIIFRTGGDVLWESYVERTGDMVTLPDFYKTRLEKLSSKEKMIFHLMRWTFHNLSAIVWSTAWQRDICMEPYCLKEQKNFIIENYYGSKMPSVEATQKVFVSSGRTHALKNTKALRNLFQDERVKSLGAVLDSTSVPFSEFQKKIQSSYAVIVASLSDISPNTILDAIRFSKPFIVTEENGLRERIENIALFVNPKNQADIMEKVLWLCDEGNYNIQKKKIMDFNFIHTWEDIAREYIEVYSKIT